MRFKSLLSPICLVAFVLLVFSAMTFAQHQINYQGHLTDSDGSPVADGSYQMTITI